MPIAIKFGDKFKRELNSMHNSIYYNHTGNWLFHAGLNWSFMHYGSYKQAAYIARKMYSQYRETGYGTITVVDFEKKEDKQLKLF